MKRGFGRGFFSGLLVAALAVGLCISALAATRTIEVDDNIRITINGANVPSDLIAGFLFGIQDKLTEWLVSISAPAWVNGLFVEGVYRTLAWVNR